MLVQKISADSIAFITAGRKANRRDSGKRRTSIKLPMQKIETLRANRSFQKLRIPFTRLLFGNPLLMFIHFSQRLNKGACYFKKETEKQSDDRNHRMNEISKQTQKKDRNSDFGASGRGNVLPVIVTAMRTPSKGIRTRRFSFHLPAPILTRVNQFSAPRTSFRVHYEPPISCGLLSYPVAFIISFFQAKVNHDPRKDSVLPTNLVRIASASYFSTTS